MQNGVGIKQLFLFDKSATLKCSFVCLCAGVLLFVCLDDLPAKGTHKLPLRYINTKLATANLSHTNIGLMSMIMNYTKTKKKIM